MQKTTEITKESFHGQDGYYGTFFTCSSCNEHFIITRFKFCPDCGVRLVWKVDSNYLPKDFYENQSAMIQEMLNPGHTSR